MIRPLMIPLLLSDPVHYGQKAQHPEHVCYCTCWPWQIDANWFLGQQGWDYCIAESWRNKIYWHQERWTRAMHYHQVYVSCLVCNNSNKRTAIFKLAFVIMGNQFARQLVPVRSVKPGQCGLKFKSFFKIANWQFKASFLLPNKKLCLPKKISFLQLFKLIHFITKFGILTKSSFTWQKHWVRTFQERGHIIVWVNFAYLDFLVSWLSVYVIVSLITCALSWSY